MSRHPRGRATEQRLDEHVRRLGEEHPPIPLSSVDLTVRRPAEVAQRYGHVLDYMARVELEVDRNVLELTTLLPDPPPVDVTFYRDVWRPQEVQHGLILDALQQRLGRPPARADLDTVSPKIRLLGTLAHVPAVQDVVRMLYYLTGMSTERSAVLAYHQLHEGLVAMEERALAESVVAPIRRQEPGHYAFYRLSARGLAARLRPWQTFLVRHLRRLSYGPVGANDDEQRADFGDLMTALGIDRDLAAFTGHIARVERELLWAHRQGMAVPDYVVDAFRDALALSRARAGTPGRGPTPG